MKGIFLAAGMSRRFGSQKLLHNIGGIPVVCKSLQSCIESDLEELIVVTGADQSDVKRVIFSRFPDNRKIRVVFNPDYGEGMFSSFKAGLNVVGSEIENVMMIFGDMPFVSPKTINDLIGKYKEGCFVIPRVGGSFTHPRIIPSVSFEDFISLPANGKGLDILKRFGKKIIVVDFEIADEFRDIDKP